MVAAIHQSNAQLGTKKMLRSDIHAVFIIRALSKFSLTIIIYYNSSDD